VFTPSSFRQMDAIKRYHQGNESVCNNGRAGYLPCDQPIREKLHVSFQQLE